MGLERMDVGVKVRKFIVISIISFVVFLFGYCISCFGLHCCIAWYPFEFSGHRNIPEIDEHEEENVSHEVSPLKTGVSEDDTVVKRDFNDDDFVVERHVGKMWDIVENADEKVSLVDNEVNEVEEGDCSVLYKPLINDDLDSRDVHCENGMIDEVEGLLNHSLLEKMTGIRGEMLESERVLSMRRAEESQHLLAEEVGDRNVELGDGKLTSYIDDVPRDISLMLDELHPLLGSEAIQAAQLSRDGLDSASESSHGSSDDESDESENKGEGENNEEEGGAKGDNEDESKSAIKWTEDDQKNLMDLGNLEVERNLRLDKLIARRRARKSMRLMAEKNLIDLDFADIPLNLAPISTSRGNPFDLPYSYDDLGLPPIPGSAPSNLQPRRNPFDLPYDSSEEKPDLKGDSFQEEFSGFNQRGTNSQKEAFFSRHESFNVGSSSLGVPRQELKWKPYFVPEQLVTEGASPSLFQRQSSEVSESKLSSIPDSESVSSVVDEEDNKPNKQDVSRETELILNEDHVSVDEQESHSSDSDDVESMDVDQVENRDVHHDVVEITLGDGESHLEIEPVSEAGATDHSEHTASEAENRDVHHDTVVITLGDVARATTHVELNATEIHPRTEPAEEDYSSRSSLSSLSEIDEKISDVKGVVSAGCEPRDNELKESGISKKLSFEESEFHFTSGVVDDNQHTESIFYSSFHPPSIETFLSFSTVSSDKQAEISEMGSPSMLVESIDEKHEAHGEMAEQGTSSFQVMHGGSSDLLNGNEPRERDLPEIIKHEVTFAGSAMVSSTSADYNASMVPEYVVEYVSREARSSSDEGLEEDVPNKEESSIQNHVDLLSLGAETTLAIDEGMGEVVDSSPEEQQHQRHPNESSEANIWEEHKKESEMDQTQAPFSDSKTNTGCDEGVPSNSSHQDLSSRESPSSESEKQLLFDKDELPVDEHDKLEEPSIIATESTRGADIVNTDINVHEVDDSEDKLSANFSLMTSGSSSLPSEILEHTLPMDREDLKEKVLKEIENEGPDDHFGYADVYAPRVDEENNNEEVDEIKEIDERILSELDTVGDFNVGEIGLPERSHVAYTESAMLADDMETETSVGLPVLEARSVEDIDLAFKQLHEGADFEEVILPRMIKNQPDHADTNSDLPVVEVRSLEDIHNALLQDPEPNLAQLPHSTDLRNGSSEVEQHVIVSSEEIEVSNAVSGIEEGFDNAAGEPKNEEEIEELKTETNVELPVLEARSVEDIDLAFKQLHEGVDVEEVILPSMIENLPDHTDTTSEFPVVEAISLDGIHNAFIKGPEPNPAELPHTADLRHGSSEVEQHDVVCSNEIEVGQAVSGFEEHLQNVAPGEPKKEYEEIEELKMETNAELPVLDARSVEDIDLAFKQLHEGVDVEEVVLASMIEDQLDHEDSTSKLPVVEARSLEDIHNAFQKGPEPNLAELPLSTDLRNGSSEMEQHDVVSNKEIEVGRAVSGIQENSQNSAELPVLEARSLEDIDLAFKQFHEGVDVEEIILPSMIENQQGDADTNSDLPVVEARSLEGIQSAFQQGPESNLAEVPHSSGVEHPDVVSTEEIDGSSPVSGIQAMSENVASGPKNENKEMVEKEMETEVVLPVLEAKSVEDIDVAFKQLHEGVNVEEIIIPSMIVNQQVHADTSSTLPVVEARSLEDIHNAFQQAPESNPGELSHSSDLRIGSSEIERHDEISTEEIEASNVVSGIQEHAENAAGEPEQKHHEESSEKPNLET
ncbi:hypothetical protein GOBAR_AA04005 [Gossypium barbadense]|uniref:Uncharacterized protein n=1 Tax=Gossypium barbadense TaxID=3634 RepID=A0A2P5YLT9_GOSBA|nr:hypothetical protein GOBAR_AA04005 [Gossypium barbadense]